MTTGRRIPHNFARLTEVFGLDAAGSVTLLSGEEFEVDGVTFVCDYKPESTSERFFIVKPLRHVQRYAELFTEWRGATIVELGIAEGGSTVFAALLARPRKLVAVDLERQSLPALEDFIRRRHLGDVVRPYWGVDQADATALRRIVADELAGGRIDIVIDDASHQLDLTRSSFETLFPLVRPGGLYIVEDWNNDHQFHDAVRAALRDTSSPDHDALMDAFRDALADDNADGRHRHRPLSELAIELLLARASSGDAVARLTLNQDSFVVERGPGALDPENFRIADLYDDHFGLVPARRFA